MGSLLPSQIGRPPDSATRNIRALRQLEKYDITRDFLYYIPTEPGCGRLCGHSATARYQQRTDVRSWRTPSKSQARAGSRSSAIP